MRKLEPAILQRMLGSLRDELAKIEGVALCLSGLTEDTVDEADVRFPYLGDQLNKHSNAALRALDETQLVDRR
jgi:hypothetical protein